MCIYIYIYISNCPAGQPRHRAEYQGALSKDVGGTLMTFCVKCSGTLPAKCIPRSPGMRGPLSRFFFNSVWRLWVLCLRNVYPHTLK